MKLQFYSRILVATGLFLGIGLLLLVWLYATERALEVWERLQSTNSSFFLIYGLFVIAFAVLIGWLSWRLLHSPRSKKTRSCRTPASEKEVESRLKEVEALGVDVSGARKELETLQERRQAAKIYVALFGEISTGKSSLIKAMLPNSTPKIDPRGGTTRLLTHYDWYSTSGDQIILTDMPGLNSLDEGIDELSRDEAMRAHVVIYVVNGDLTRDQYKELEYILSFNKPVVLALNKIDRFKDHELEILRHHLASKLARFNQIEIVEVSAGGQREVTKILADGREQTEIQEISATIDPLLEVLQKTLEEDPKTLETLRDTAIFSLAARKLEESVCEYRHRRATELVTEYSRKAVLGALVSITPGTDLIIQGFLGISLVRSLCEVHQVSIRDTDITRFLKNVSKNVNKTLPIILAVSGNAFKAFPGLGTVAGGLLHAVGYGLIFDSLGKAIAQTLEQTGELAEAPTLRLLEEKLSDDLEGRARYFAKMALAQRKQQDS